MHNRHCNHRTVESSIVLAVTRTYPSHSTHNSHIGTYIINSHSLSHSLTHTHPHRTKRDDIN